jgi:hypothetical protein
MPATDAPDWQTIITLQSGGAVTDAPDWTDVVTGPGGTPVGPAPGGGIVSVYFNAGFIGVTVDPNAAQTTIAHTQGVVALTIFSALATTSATGMTFNIWLGATCTANQNFLGIYDAGQTTAGVATLLGQTAAGVCDTPFATTAVHSVNFISPIPLIEGQSYYVGLLNNGGQPGLSAASCSQETTINPLGNTLPFRCFLPSPNLVFPSTIAFSATTLTNNAWLLFVN